MRKQLNFSPVSVISDAADSENFTQLIFELRRW